MPSSRANIFNKTWKLIALSGISRSLSTDMKKKIILANSFSLYASMFAFITGFAFINIPSIYIIFVISIFVYLSAIFMNRFKWYNAARWLLVITPPLFNLWVAGLITEGPNYSNRFTLIVLIICPILLFQLSEIRKMVIGVIWIGLCFFFFDDITNAIQRIPEIKFDSDFDNVSLLVYRGLITMFFLVIAFIYLMRLNAQNEKKLEESLKNTKEKNLIIQDKNKLLEQQYQAIQIQQEEIGAINKALRSQALRAQMDPHFMFNVLNSMQHFVMQNDSVSALSYMSKFSKLIRQVLENSVNDTVLIADEMKALSFYIELEKMRFDHCFDYVIEIDEQVDAQNTEIPSMLLQPYVENAIGHGLRHKPAGGLLKIVMMYQYTHILCIIEDNGIGRQAVTAMMAGRPQTHISRATSVNLNRIALLQSGANIITADLKNEDGSAAGTRVEIKIPLQL